MIVIMVIIYMIIYKFLQETLYKYKEHFKFESIVEYLWMMFVKINFYD